MTDRLQQIENLEDNIFTELKEMDSIDFEKMKENEQRKFYNECQNYEKQSLKNTKNMKKISTKFSNFVKKIKPFIIPDEKNWKLWNGKDFCKWILNFKSDLKIIEPARFDANELAAVESFPGLIRTLLMNMKIQNQQNQDQIIQKIKIKKNVNDESEEIVKEEEEEPQKAKSDVWE